MSQKLLSLLFFVFWGTNVYGLECWLKCFKDCVGQEVEQPEAENLVAQPPREILISTYNNDRLEPRKDSQRMAMLQEYFLSFPAGLAELIGSYDYTGKRCYIDRAYLARNGLIGAIRIRDEDGKMHMYVAYDPSLGVLCGGIDPTLKAATMSVKQMQHVYALRKIQNQPFAPQEVEDAELVLLQHEHDIPEPMIKLARARLLVTVPGEY